MSVFVKHSACPKCQENGKDTRGNNLGNYSDGSSHCYSCGHHVFATSQRWQQQETREKYNHLLPVDFSRQVPAIAWKWLLQYGIPYSYWQDKVGWSGATKRLVFRVGNPLAFSIGRFFQDAEGLDPRNTGKWYVWGESHKHTEVIRHTDAASDTTVLVEDVISAHKVGMQYNAIPIFGSELHTCHTYYLAMSKGRVVLWLDRDQQDNVYKKAMRLETLINRPVEVLVTDKDPKSLPFNVIKGVVGA